MTPLDYLLSVMRDTEQGDDARRDAAKAAAPYVHPKLASVELTGDREKPVALSLASVSTAALREVAAAGFAHDPHHSAS